MHAGRPQSLPAAHTTRTVRQHGPVSFTCASRAVLPATLSNPVPHPTFKGIVGGRHAEGRATLYKHDTQRSIAVERRARDAWRDDSGAIAARQIQRKLLARRVQEECLTIRRLQTVRSHPSGCGRAASVRVTIARSMARQRRLELDSSCESMAKKAATRQQRDARQRDATEARCDVSATRRLRGCDGY